MKRSVGIRVRIGEVVTDRRLDGDELKAAIRSALEGARQTGAFKAGPSAARVEVPYVRASLPGLTVSEVGEAVATTVVHAVAGLS